MGNTFQIVIAARDQASGTIVGVNSALSRVPASLNRISAAMERVGDASALERLQQGAIGLARPALDAARGFGVLNNTLGLALGAGSVAGAAALAARWGAVGVSANNAAQSIGVSAGRLRTLQNAAGLAGLSADAMTGGLGSLATALQDAAFGRNNEAQAMINTLGIAARRTATGVWDLERAMGDIAEAVAKQTSPQAQARVAKAFGVEALLPMLRKGRSGWNSYIAEIERLASVSEETQQRSEALGISLNKLEAAAVGVGVTLEARVSSRFGRLIDSTTEWIAANKELAADLTLVATALVGLAAAGKGVAILTSGLVSLSAAIGSVLGGATALAAHPVIATLVGAATILTPSTANEGEDEKLRQLKEAGKLTSLPAPAPAPSAVPPVTGGAVSSAGIGEGVRRWDPQIEAMAAKYGVAPDFVRRIMQQESGGRQFGKDGQPLTSSAGAIGLMQVMPGTFAEMAQRYGIRGGITDPDANIEAGVAYLSEQIKRFGNEATAAAAYNAGPNRVQQTISEGKSLPAETQNYIASIAAMQRQQGQGAGGDQSVKVDINIGGNVPPGTTATATDKVGNTLPARVEYTMPSFASP